MRIGQVLKTIWQDQVWSKVIAGIITAALLALAAWIVKNLGWWSVLAAKWPVPRWLLGLLVLLILILAVLLHRTRRVAIQNVWGASECKDEIERCKREMTRLEEELKVEKDSLQDCPQVAIEVEESNTQREVVVHNVSHTIDAFDIEMSPVEGNDVRLVAERIHHLRAGEIKHLELSAERIRKRAGLPELPAQSEARVFFEEAADKNPFSTANVTIHYRDSTSRKQCASSAIITWYISPVNQLAGIRFERVYRV